MLTPGNHQDDDDTDANGDFLIEEVPAGDYTLRVDIAKYLAAEKDITVQETANSTGHDVKLWGGDVNGDDRINIQDLAIIGARFGSQDSADTDVADINDDGIVNIQDLAIAAGNYGKETSDYSW